MYNPKTKPGFLILLSISLVSVIFVLSCPLTLSAWTHGLQCAQGYGMGRGMQRGYGYMQGYGEPIGPRGRGAGPGMSGGPCGADLQRGILQEPSYCRMLMNRPDLNLTSEQKEALRKLQIKHIKETSDLRADLQVNKIELKKLRFSKNPDINSLKSKLEKISKLQLELQISRLKLQMDADKILTEEQKNSLYLSPDMAVDLDWEEETGEEEIQ